MRRATCTPLILALAAASALTLAGCGKRPGHDNPSGPRPPAPPGSGPATAAAMDDGPKQ